MIAPARPAGNATRASRGACTAPEVLIGEVVRARRLRRAVQTAGPIAGRPLALTRRERARGH